MQNELGWTAAVARFVASSPVEWSDELRSAVYDGVIDWFSSVLTAKDDATAEQLMASMGNEPPYSLTARECTVIGKPYKAGVLDAALVNGYLAHALDYDDVHEEVRGHPSAVLIAALLAEAEYGSISGKPFKEGYLIGMEVMCQLGRWIGNSHYELGWHSTATLGAIAAAAAVARMRGFTEEQARHAIGLAATQAGGLRLHFGSAVKPLHAGIAARAGVMAARMAYAGIQGSDEVLDGKLGFIDMYSGGSPAFAEPDIEQWGKPWRIVQPGLWFKIYPCCSASYHAIDAAHELWIHNGYTADEIAQVNVIFPPGGDAALVANNPGNGVEGRFSAEYIVALKLTQPMLELGDFDEGAIREDMRQLMQRVRRHYREDIPAAPTAMPKGRFTIVEVVKTDGTVQSSRSDTPTGSPGKPLSEGDKLRKYEAAAKGMASGWKELPRRVRQLEQLKAIADLWRS